MVQSNGQKKWYKYGENMQDINYKESVDKVLGLRFGNNKKIGTYTREVSPSEVEAADSTNFEIRVVYETKIRNESSTLYMKPNEIVSFYDTKYEDEVKNVSSTPWDESRPAEINVSWQKDASHVRNGRHSQSHQDYKAAYGEVQWGTGVPIKNQKSVSIYTQYTIKRNQAYKIYEGDVVFYNQVEINSYSTSDEYLHKRTAINKNYYAGIDSDSAAGSAKIEPENDKGFESWEDDTDDAPDFKLQKAKNRKIQGTVFKDTIITSGAEGGEYRGNGVNDGDKPLSGVRVELVELNDNGTEKLWDHNVSEAEDNPYKPNSSNILQRSGERQQNTTMVELDEDLDNPSSTVQALKYTGNDGKYEFSGFIPGRYIIKFTWGGECSTVPVNVANTDEYIYPEQYKSTTFVDRNRYNEYTGGGSNPTRWLLRNDYRRNSNAIDDMEKRFELDQKMLEVDGSTSGYGNFVDIAEKGTIMNSRTPAFEVGVEALDKDKDGGNANKEAVDIGKGEQGSDQVLLNADGLDFGICERPKMGISLKKEVERVKVTLANGQTLVDAEVNGGTMLRGVILGTTIMPPNPANPATGYKGDIGKFKIEMDGEIMQGAILEITYKYTIINKSNKDFVITSGDSNNPYLFKEHTDQNTYFKFNEISLADQDVEIEPTIIVDYLSNGMNYLREEEGDKNVPEENSCWERVSEDEQQERITKHFFNFRNTILYGKYKNEENRYEDYYRDGRVLDHDSEIIEDTDKRMDVLNKYYWTIVRDQERNASADRIRLKAGYQAERKFVASKVLTSTNEDMEFYNSAEIIKITKNGGAQPERQIPGDELPLKEVTSDVYTADLQPAKEEDGSTAEYTTITGPTGDIYNNYEKGVIIAVALAGLSILGIGTAIIRRIVFTMENRKQKIKKQKGGKQKKTK